MGVTQRESFDLTRRIVANMTTESWRTIPHVSLVAEIEVGPLLARLEALNARRAEPLRLNTVLLGLTAESLKAAPRLNAHLRFQRRLVRGCLELHDEIDFTMATLLPDGRMMTLRVPDAGTKSLDALQQTVDDLLRRAAASDLQEALYEVSMADTLRALREGKLLRAAGRLWGARVGAQRLRLMSARERRVYRARPATARLTAADLRQGTVTVSNLGAVCRDWTGACALLEITPPQVAAIGFGALALRPVADADGTLRAARVLPLTLAFDHRALDTGDAAPFLETFRRLCRESETFLARHGAES